MNQQTAEAERRLSLDQWERIGTLVLDAAGSPHDESELVSQSLVRSSAMGHDSHGVMRLIQYVGDIRKGILKPGAPFTIVNQTPATAVADAHRGWGQVSAHKAMTLAIEKAEQQGIGVVAVHNNHHVGRLGQYPAMAVPHDMIGLGFISSGGGIDRVAPWGGIDARLGPNPMSFATPSGRDWPVLLDMTTSVVPEGKVRVARYRNLPLPEGCLIDPEGRPTTDPNVHYGDPLGALLCLGGIAGHKGYGLNLMMELLGGALSGTGVRGTPDRPEGNGVHFQAIKIASFVAMQQFLNDVDQLILHVKSSRRQPGVSEILFPGEPEHRNLQRRMQEGIPVDVNVWKELCEVADELGVGPLNDVG